MPSPTSSSDPARFARLTAADRPGVAQPVPVREVPVHPWPAICATVLTGTVLLLAGWEWYWRASGATPGYRNSDGLWAMQRRRIDEGEGDATVLLGASRILLDVRLPVWERLSGRRPIQLALEQTSPMFALEDLADDPQFTGRLIVGVAPDVFFRGLEYRKGVLGYYRDETPSQRVGQWLSMRWLEPYFASYDPDFTLFAVVKRQVWPARPGLEPSIDMRKLMVMDMDRDTRLWSRVESDPDYRALCRRVWAQDFYGAPTTPEDRAKAARKLEEVLARAAAAVAKLRARGVSVLFVRPPSDGEYLAFEDRVFPRSGTWDALLARTGAPGIHFRDYPELQGFYLPEWAHLSRADAERFTQALYRIIDREFPAKAW